MRNGVQSSVFSGVMIAGVLLVMIPPCPAQQPGQSPPGVERLIQQLTIGSSEERLNAAEELGNMGPFARRAVPALAATLTSKDPALKYEVLVALSSVGPLAAEAAESVAAQLDSELLPIRVTVLDTLRRIGTIPESAVPQIETLAGDANQAVVVAAVRCLITLEREDSTVVTASVPALISSLSNERRSVRNAAASALVEIGSSVVPALATAFASDQPVVRLKACEVARRLGVDASPLIPNLIDRLQDEDELVVRSAATALGSVRSDAHVVLPALTKLLSADSLAVRADVVSAIGEFSELAGETVVVVCKMVENDDSAIVRAAAAETLGRIGGGSEQAAQSLVRAIEDVHGGVTVQAANALSQLGAKAVPVLLPLLKNPLYRDLAISVLGEIGPDAAPAVPALVSLLNDDDEELLREVFIALATIGPGASSSVSDLQRILQDSDAGFSRAGAAYVLGNIGDKSCLPVLKEILNEAKPDTDARLLRASAWSLISLQPNDQKNAAIVMPYLMDALSSDRSLARKEALAAIGKLGAAANSATDKLMELALSDPEPVVRSEAMHTLALLPQVPDESLPIAVAAMNDDDPVIRNSARFLLGQMGPKAKETAAELKKGIREGSELDRIVSAWALLRVEPTDEYAALALPLMLKALENVNPQVRTEAAHTIGTIGTSSVTVLTALKSAVLDPVPEVAAAAKLALTKLK